VSVPVVEDKETSRIEAFSDGVFAIAITLLVLDLKVPQLDENALGGQLRAALLSEWPSYIAFLVSFATILIMWVNHHRLFTLIRRSDSLLLFLNGFLLLAVTTVPFPTRLLSEYLERPAAPIACAVYCALYVILAIGFNTLWYYAAHGQRLLGASVTQQESSQITRSYIAGPLLYFIALVFSFVNVFVSVAICAGLAIFFAWKTFER
jgi:uncharacterized membrane protein